MSKLSDSEESSGWSHELDYVPLVQRKKLLHRLKSVLAEELSGRDSLPLVSSFAVKREDEHINSEVDCSGSLVGIKQSLEITTEISSLNQSLEIPDRSAASKLRSSGVGTSNDKIAGSTFTNCQCFQFSDNCSATEPMDLQNHIEVHGPEFMSSDERQPNGQNDCCGQNYACELTEDVGTASHLTSGKVKVEPHDDNGSLSHEGTIGSDVAVQEDGWSNELDHVPLILRRQMLLMSKQAPGANQLFSHISLASERPSTTSGVPMLKEEKRVIPEDYVSHVDMREFPISYIHRESMAKTVQHCKQERRNFSICDSATGTCKATSELRNTVEARESQGSSSSEFNPCSGGDLVSSRTTTVLNSTLDENVRIKVEPVEHNERLSSNCNAVGDLVIKSDEDFHDDLSEDKMDHILLGERIKLLISHAHSGALLNAPAPCGTPILGSVKPISIKRPWKRKRTATDSVETALEEDAPGLLRVLVDNGVSIDEIKLYGNEEDDELADEDESSGMDVFSELEDVILKLFSRRQPILKFGPIQGTKDTKASYCLACLFSLVEQARYLHFRKWPAEWGWCRDLQSFIFIFERHRRIVLERPEYGYATYFFELVDSLPIEWQIRRLVTTMKLSSCSRVTLMENKALLIGEDLSEGEAQVLIQYGWTPNTGIGTMLNYRDRVVHDRKNDNDTSVWRAKIGKLLVDGCCGGRIVLSDIPKKVIEYEEAEIVKVKLEM